MAQRVQYLVSPLLWHESDLCPGDFYLPWVQPKKKKKDYYYYFFLGLHLRYMEIPRLGVKLELQLLAYSHSHNNVGSKPSLRPTPQLTAAGLHHSHNNVGSEPHLQPIPQLTATPDP